MYDAKVVLLIGSLVDMYDATTTNIVKGTLVTALFEN